MNMLEALAGKQGRAATDQLAAQFGLDPAQAQSALEALMPAVAAGIQRNISTEAGLSGLLSALKGGNHGSYVDNPRKLVEPGTTADGNAILGHILGSKEASRQVASRAASQTGIDPDILKKMLPLAAAMAMGGLAKKTRGGGSAAAAAGIAAILGSMTGQGQGGSAMGGVAGMLGGILGRRKDS